MQSIGSSLQTGILIVALVGLANAAVVSDEAEHPVPMGLLAKLRESYELSTRYEIETEIRSTGYASPDGVSRIRYFRDGVFRDIRTDYWRGEPGEVPLTNRRQWVHTRQGEAIAYAEDEPGVPSSQVNTLRVSLESPDRLKSIATRQSGAQTLEGFYNGTKDSLVDLAQKADSHVEYAGRASVDGVDCHKVLVQTREEGVFTLWLDPENGCLPVRVEAERNPEHEYADLRSQLPKNAPIPKKYRQVMSGVKFERVGGSVFPVSCKLSETTEYEDGRVISGELTVKRLSINLTPDFDEAGAFKAMAPTGTIAYIHEHPGIRYKYTSNGELQPYVEDGLETEIDQALAELKAQGTSLSRTPLPVDPIAPSSTESADSQDRPWWNHALVVVGVSAVLFILFAVRKRRGSRRG
jgi:hypothetical protein